MASWIYILADNDHFPDPVEEIAALAAMDEEDEAAFLMLAARARPPMKNAQPNETVHLCTRLPDNSSLFRRGTAIVMARPVLYHGTPQSVQPIYGDVADCYFVRIGDFDLEQAGQLPDEVLPQAQQKVLLRGQSFVKRLVKPGRKAPPHELPAHVTPAPARNHRESETFAFSPLPQLPMPVKACTVVGLDPTAGTWESHMESGDKKMPSVTISVQPGSRLRIEEVSWHESNQDFWDLVQRKDASTICLDGPCQTNGPRVLDDWSDWDRQANDGKRLCELQLHRKGVHLFWTTNKTVLYFKGASRWIARSLRLFGRALAFRCKAIETHPHGAFVFLWRRMGGKGRLPNKRSPQGRASRLAILRAFVENVNEEQLPDHDAVDSACAALVAAFYEVGWVESYGDDTQGGRIWMPKIPT